MFTYLLQSMTSGFNNNITEYNNINVPKKERTRRAKLLFMPKRSKDKAKHINKAPYCRTTLMGFYQRIG